MLSRLPRRHLRRDGRHSGRQRYQNARRYHDLLDSPPRLPESVAYDAARKLDEVLTFGHRPGPQLLEGASDGAGNIAAKRRLVSGNLSAFGTITETDFPANVLESQ